MSVHASFIPFADRAARNAAMARAYLDDGLTLSEVGHRFGMSKQGAQQALRAQPGVTLRPLGRTKAHDPVRYVGGQP